MASEELVSKSKELLGTVFTLYSKMHIYHWNVTGPNFPQYHSFLGDLYNEVWSSVDDIAEHIRTLNSFAPTSLNRLILLNKLSLDDTIPPADKMFSNLMRDNSYTMDLMFQVIELCNREKEYAFSNFLQDRLDIHKKHQWMLKSIISAGEL